MNKELIILMRKTIKKGDLELVKQLIKNNDDLLNYMTGFGSWLHVAAAHNKIDITEYLLECGIDVNIESDDVCVYEGGAIVCASSRGNLDIVKLLYKRGAKLDVSTANSNALFCAIPDGYFEIVKFLVENGIDIKKKYDIGTCGHIDAYEYAKQYGQTEIANYLKEKLK